MLAELDWGRPGRLVKLIPHSATEVFPETVRRGGPWPDRTQFCSGQNSNRQPGDGKTVRGGGWLKDAGCYGPAWEKVSLDPGSFLWLVSASWQWRGELLSSSMLFHRHVLPLYSPETTETDGCGLKSSESMIQIKSSISLRRSREICHSD